MFRFLSWYSYLVCFVSVSLWGSPPVRLRCSVVFLIGPYKRKDERYDTTTALDVARSSALGVTPCQGTSASLSVCTLAFFFFCPRDVMTKETNPGILFCIEKRLSYLLVFRIRYIREYTRIQVLEYIFFILWRMGKNKAQAPTLRRIRCMCFDLTHAPVATAARAAATGPVSMSTRSDPGGSDGLIPRWR